MGRPNRILVDKIDARSTERRRDEKVFSVVYCSSNGFIICG